jgi:glycerophosphoryl diester phosphodiesterase
MKARLYAHRGAAAELPENTLPAFARALDVGATALETDCHMTRDGAIVVSHDASGTRMANVARAISESTLDEVRAWDVGWGFVDGEGRRPFSGKGYRIPTLEELLVWIPGVPLNVDCKQFAPDMIPRVLEVVRRAKACESTLLTSFDARLTRRIRALGYEGPTGLAQAEVIRLLALPARALRLWKLRGAAAQLPHRQGPIDLGRRALIDKCHALGLVVHYWTVNEPARAKELLALGADGIMSDDPRTIASALGIGNRKSSPHLTVL